MKKKLNNYSVFNSWC